MPTAQKFFTSGAGNGLAVCAEKVNLQAPFFRETEQGDYTEWGPGTPYTHWTTLGGYNKLAADAGTPPTAEQIYRSRQNAWELYWMLYSVKGSYSDSEYGSGNLEMKADDDFSTSFSIPVGSAEPKGRRCGKLNEDTRFRNSDFEVIKLVKSQNYGLFRSKFYEVGEPPTISEPDGRSVRVHVTSAVYGNGGKVDGFVEDDEGNFTVPAATNWTGEGGGIVAMYNGDTSEEANFVGYGIVSVKPTTDLGGIGSPSPENVDHPSDQGWYAGGLYFTNYEQTTGISMSLETDVPNVLALGLTSYGKFDDENAAYIEFSGIPFVGLAFNNAEGQGGFGSIDPANLTATYQGEIYEGNYPNITAIPFETTITLTDITFYD